jgi:hypothetical protein
MGANPSVTPVVAASSAASLASADPPVPPPDCRRRGRVERGCGRGGAGGKHVSCSPPHCPGGLNDILPLLFPKEAGPDFRTPTPLGTAGTTYSRTSLRRVQRPALVTDRRRDFAAAVESRAGRRRPATGRSPCPPWSRRDQWRGCAGHGNLRIACVSVCRSPSLSGINACLSENRRMAFWERPAPALADRDVLG